MLGIYNFEYSGGDLAYKNQILSYYELVLNYMKSTGRVFFYPQYEYLGDGRFNSYFGEEIQYQVSTYLMFIYLVCFRGHLDKRMNEYPY